MTQVDRSVLKHQTLEIKPHYPFITKLLLDLFQSNELPNVRAVDIEPEYGHAGRIVYKNGSIQLFRATKLGINSLGASEISRDKGYTKYFLDALGYCTPRGRVFLQFDHIKAIDKKLSKYGFKGYMDINSIYSYIAATIGYPCFIKPNASSQGNGVNKCFDQEDVAAAVSAYQINGVKIFLVEESVNWPDYRVVVLRDQVISCYLRKPLQVVGDGTSTIRHLLLEKQERFAEDQRDTHINIDDPRIAKKLERSNSTLETILSSGEIWQVYDISNLSAGGEAEDYTDRICTHWRDLCIKVVRDMGLIFCGVDLACANVEDPNAAYSILEINAAPGLDNYAASGQKQAIAVRQLYKKVFSESMQEGS